MDSSKAIGRVRSLIRGSLEKEHGSPTIVGIFQNEINESVQRLRDQFKIAKSRGHEDMIWPRMVVRYQPDADGEGVCPVWGPIRDADGYILGLKVFSQTQGGVPRKQRVHLDWYPPEPE